MAFWILILVAIFCYLYAGLCVFLAAKPPNNRTDFGERLFMFDLSIFLWPFLPIVYLLAGE